MSATIAATPRPEQCRLALERANQARTGGRDIKRELAAGAITFAAALDDPRAQPIVVWQLVCALPRVGPSVARRIFNRAQVNPNRRVRELTVRQKHELAYVRQHLFDRALSADDEAILQTLTDIPMQAAVIAEHVGLTVRSMGSLLRGLECLGLAHRVVLRDGTRPVHGWVKS